MNDERYLQPWTVMHCTSSTSNVLVCGGVSRSDCEIYDPRSMARPISNVYMYDITRNVQAVVTASSNSNYAVFILDGQVVHKFYGKLNILIYI